MNKMHENNFWKQLAKNSIDEEEYEKFNEQIKERVIPDVTIPFRINNIVNHGYKTDKKEVFVVIKTNVPNTLDVAYRSSIKFSDIEDYDDLIVMNFDNTMSIDVMIQTLQKMKQSFLDWEDKS